MPPLLIPNPSEAVLLRAMLGVDVTENLVARLYVNDVTPGATDVAATYTEMSTLGYASKTLTKTSWTVTADAGGSGQAEGVYAEQTYTFTAGTPVTVYGYYVTRASTGDLAWAERFAQSYVVQNDGDFIKLTPKFRFYTAP